MVVVFFRVWCSGVVMVVGQWLLWCGGVVGGWGDVVWLGCVVVVVWLRWFGLVIWCGFGVVVIAVVWCGMVVVVL